jgi:hypothetical protein
MGLRGLGVKSLVMEGGSVISDLGFRNADLALLRA